MKKEDIKYIIVHHTATAKDTTTFKAVKNYHINTRGWKDIGYHFFIEAHQMLIGRPRNVVGCHCKVDGMNFKSLGVAVTGNFEKEYPTERQLNMLKETLDNLRKEFNIPKENVLGHKEAKGASTACPGKNLMTWLALYRGDEQIDIKKELEKQKEELKNQIINYIKSL